MTLGFYRNTNTNMCGHEGTASTVLLRGACARTLPAVCRPAMPWANPSQCIVYIHKFNRRCAVYLASVQFNSQSRSCRPYGDSGSIMTSNPLLRISNEMIMAFTEPTDSLPCSYSAFNTEWNEISFFGQTRIPIFILLTKKRKPDSNCQKTCHQHFGKCEILTNEKQFSSNWSLAKTFCWLLKITPILWI
jgi:hypothetical protein